MEDNYSKQYSDFNDDKPVLLKAIEIILAEPADIKRETVKLYQRYEENIKQQRLLMKLQTLW